ncbi:hypothetical protein Bca4012_025222 [Brassica carinata]|uniref:Uncharacterized protein n=1 Tax=Brassica carinata TaxID=52824 RepID=A0A8X7VGD6_BRACI|nr:hypothetical protein Bca52824_022273 [Brassica carinata]
MLLEIREGFSSIKVWVGFDFTMAVADTREEVQRSLILFFCSSLRSSLVSREGVYKRTFSGFWVVDVMFGLFSTASTPDLLENDVSKQRRKKEPSIRGRLKVLNLHLLKEKGNLWLHIKSQLLQVLVQQNLRWKKHYKSRKFKYKCWCINITQNQWRLNISFQMISLRASLFSMGDVLIDTKYFSIDLEVKKLTWLGLTYLMKRSLAESWNDTEGLLLEVLKQLSRGDLIRNGYEDDEGLILCMLLFVDAMSLDTVAMRSS